YREGPLGTVFRVDGSVSLGLLAGDGAGESVNSRASITLDAEGRVAGRRVLGRTMVAGVAGPNPAPQHHVFLGGPVSAPGYDYHSLVGRAGVSQRIEVWQPAPFFPVPLGRFGRAPGTMTVAPYLNVAYVGGGDALGDREGLYPSVGVAALFLFDLLRIDVARGLRDGRWWFGVDVSRDLWGIL